MEEFNFLERLIGQKVINVDTSINTTIPLNKRDDDKIVTTIAPVILFLDYRLMIENPHTVTRDNKPVYFQDLVGLEVLGVVENSSNAKIFFSFNTILEVDLRDEAFSGPEAMSLSGPENFWAVWR